MHRRYLAGLVLLLLAIPAHASADDRPAALPWLYAGTITAHALDLHSTHRALSTGAAREANPFMTNASARVAIKAGTTTLTVWTAERLWKGGRRKTAIALVAAVTAGTAAIAARNYRVAR